MTKKRKTTTGTENASGKGGTMEDLAREEGVHSPVATASTPQEPVESPEKSDPASPASDTPSAASPATASTGASPASFVREDSKPQPPAAPNKGKRDMTAGAIRLSQITNEYVTDDSEQKEYMEEEVVVLCLKSRTLGIGLNRWEVKERVSYIVPRWFALDKRDTFVIQGQ